MFFLNYLTVTTVIFSAQDGIVSHAGSRMETSTSTKTRAWCGLFPTVENRLVAILVVLQEEVVLPTRVRIKYPAVECFELAPPSRCRSHCVRLSDPVATVPTVVIATLLSSLAACSQSYRTEFDGGESCICDSALFRFVPLEKLPLVFGVLSFLFAFCLCSLLVRYLCGARFFRVYFIFALFRVLGSVVVICIGWRRSQTIEACCRVTQWLQKFFRGILFSGVIISSTGSCAIHLDLV